MTNFQYLIQRPDGTRQMVDKNNPIPVDVTGMPELPTAIARHVTDNIVKVADVLAPKIAIHIDLNPIVETIEKYAKLALWAAAGLGFLQVTLIVLLIFVR